MIEHWIKTLNELGMKSKQGNLLAINIWESNLTKCFVSTLDAHFWCVFSSLLIKGVLDLRQRLVCTWSYPRIITLEKVAWINSMGAEYCSRRSIDIFECSVLIALFLTFSGISCVRRGASLFLSWISVEKKNRVLSRCSALVRF